MNDNHQTRRSLMVGIGTAVSALSLGSRSARAQTPGRSFQPARHERDAWLDAVPGKHRTIIDCAPVGAAGAGILYANNLYAANKSGYSLAESDIAIVVCLRHFATVFAFNDAIWGKYGKAMSDTVQFTDPKSKQAPSANLLNSASYGQFMSNLGITIQSVVQRGTQFAVCDMATHMITDQVAAAARAKPDDIYREFVDNLIPNSHLVAAGVVGVNRAQEYGYTLLTAI
jgi:hypothetical protein